MVSLEVLPLYEAEAKERQAHGQTAPGKTKKETLEADLPQASEPSKEPERKRAPQARDLAARGGRNDPGPC